MADSRNRLPGLQLAKPYRSAPIRTGLCSHTVFDQNHTLVEVVAFPHLRIGHAMNDIKFRTSAPSHVVNH